MAGHEFGTDDEHDRVGDVLRMAGSGERGALNEVGLPLWGITGHGDRAGSDGIDTHLGGKFLGQNASEENDAGFGNGVGKKFAPAHETADVGEIDDDAAARSREIRSGGLAAEERSLEISVDGGIPSGFGSLAKFGFEEIGGTVDEDIEALEFVCDARDEIVDLFDVGEISLDGDGAAAELFDFVDDFEGCLLGFTVVDRNVGAFVGETKGDCPAKALPSPGDQGDAVVQGRFGGHGRGHVRKGSTRGARTCVSDSLQRARRNPLLTERRLVVFLVHVEAGGLREGVGDSFTGDEASAAAEGEVLETPLNENLNAALELNDIHEVDEEPDEPSEEAGDVQAENIGDGSGATNNGHVTLVEIAEGRNRLLPLQARLDGFSGVASTLNGDLRDTGERLAVFVEGKGEIADDENIGIVGNGEVGKHLDAAAAISFRVSAFGNFAAEVVGSNPAGPKNGARGELGVCAVVGVVNAIGVDIVDHGVFENFDAEMGNEFFRFGGKILGVSGEYARSAIKQNDASFGGIDVAKIIAKSFASNFRERAGKLEASGTSADDDKRQPSAGLGFGAGAFRTFEGVEKFVANGGGFLNGLEAGSEGAPGVVAIVGSLRTSGDNEGIVRINAAIAKDNFFSIGIEIDGFAEKYFGVFLAAEDRAER